MINNLYEDIKQTHINSISNLNACSYDKKNNVCMLNSKKKIECINFDIVKDNICDDLDIPKISSVDSLFIKNGKIYLIEFKNYNLSKRNKALKKKDNEDLRYLNIWKELRLKSHDSIFILNEYIIKHNLNLSDIEIVIVEKDNEKEQRSMDYLREHLAEKADARTRIEHLQLFKRKLNISCSRYSVSDFCSIILTE